MKKVILTFTIIIITLVNVNSQVIYNNKIDSIINLVSIQSISKFDKELSGDTITIIGGSPYRIYSRFYQSPANAKAAQYIYEKFLSYGYTSRYQANNSTNINVIAKKTGSKYPNQYFLIGAHYDNYLNTGPSPFDTVYGADDNASGVCGVLEAARLLKNFDTDYSIIFVAFDEEELGLFGSKGYADSAYANGDNLLGVINLDMISYDGNLDNKFRIFTNTLSDMLANQQISVLQLYQIPLIPIKNYNAGGSDHQSFWARNYKAITLIEDDFNPQYHMIGDRFNLVNTGYFQKITKAAVAMLASWATGFTVEMNHIPPLSSTDTTAKLIKLFLHSPVPVATGQNAPKLYYKINTGNFTSINATSFNLDTLNFLIPGQARNTKVTYYFAFQDSASTFCVTLPTGGGGLNPPGTTPPTQFFFYNILNVTNFPSITTPKVIPDLQLMYDTIYISQSGYVEDVNVTLNIDHPFDGDLFVTLVKVGSSSTLTQFNGGSGQNYTNTIFDDSATVLISNGTPPFTGSFKPQTPLNVFNGTNMQGYWILKVFDRTAGNTGTLQNWSLKIKYAPFISVKEIPVEIPGEFKLEQNYPNPFNQTTIIQFEVESLKFVKLFVYDLMGREVETLVNETLRPGVYEVRFDAPASLSSGVYFYQLKTDNFVQTKKLVLMK